MLADDKEYLLPVLLAGRAVGPVTNPAVLGPVGPAVGDVRDADRIVVAREQGVRGLMGLGQLDRHVLEGAVVDLARVILGTDELAGLIPDTDIGRITTGVREAARTIKTDVDAELGLILVGPVRDVGLDEPQDGEDSREDSESGSHDEQERM